MRLHKIIAWRYSPPEAKDDKYDEDVHLVNQHLRREYLLKFKGWGFRHVSTDRFEINVTTNSSMLREPEGYMGVSRLCRPNSEFPDQEFPGSRQSVEDSD